MNVLITGGSGFIGRALTEQILEFNSKSKVWIFDVTGPKSGTPFIEGSIVSESALLGAIQKSNPTWIFHLAGIRSAKNPQAIEEINVGGTRALISALKKNADSKIRVITMGSAAQYGDSSNLTAVLDENSPMLPLGVYGKTKLQSENLVRDAFKAGVCDAVFARAFNAIGPGQTEDFFCTQVAKQLLEITAGKRQEGLTLGYLGGYRDFIDVRDVARGLLSLADQGHSGEAYHLSTGIGTQMAEVVKLLIRKSGLPVTTPVSTQPKRTEDISISVGSPEKAAVHTKWKPRITLEDSLGEIYQEMKRRMKIHG